MKIILSPAKKMLPAQPKGQTLTQPHTLAQTKRLLKQLKTYSPWQLEGLMGISANLALETYGMIQALDLEKADFPALFSYQGLQYQHLNAADFNLQDCAFAQEMLRILSAFYGVLRPFDRIGAYRLDFLCKMKPDGKNLYHFWGDTFYQELFAQKETVVNLASQEYAKTILPWLQPNDPWIDCVFLQIRKGKEKTPATSAKMARGELARWAVKNRLTAPEQLREFTWDGYCFDPTRSNPHKYVFLMQP